MSALEVRLGVARVGVLERLVDDEHRFSFDASWLRSPDRPVLGQFFDDRRPRNVETTGHPPCWFLNLLPQGVLRRTIVSQHGLDEDDDFGLLRVLGEDLPGAVVMTSDEPLVALEGALRFSLSGQQWKLSVRRGERGLTLPLRGEIHGVARATSHPVDTLAVVLRSNLALGNEWLLGGRPPGNRKARRAKEAQERKLEPRRAGGDARKSALEVGASVWSATDPDDLADLLDASLDDPDVGQKAIKVAGALFAGELRELPDFPSFARALTAKTSGNVLPDLLEGMRVVSVISDLFRKGGAQRRPSRASNPAADADTWDNLDLYSLPVPMLESALAGIRSLICLAALVDLGLSDRQSPPGWLVNHVVRSWVESNRSFLRLMAMLYGDENMPDDLVSKAERLDRGQLIEEHNRGEAVFDELMAHTSAHS